MASVTAHAMFPAALKDSSGKSVAFPDVCKTPPPTTGVIPLPYPNMVENSLADFEPGEYPLRQGGSIQITLTNFTPAAKAAAKTKAGSRAKLFTLKVPVQGKAEVTVKTPPQSTLYELQDGSYCAVCVANQRITRVIRLFSQDGVKVAPSQTKVRVSP